MERVDYFKIINKYVSPESRLYATYVPHVVLVTAKALRVGRRLGLSEEQLRFIEEAGMLHDIGVTTVNAPQLGATGALPYIRHITEGGRILREEGLPRHARVAENHTGVGLFADDVLSHKLDLPAQDYVVETLEEKIISWADIFFKKREEMLWRERTIEEAREEIAQYGERYAKIFEEWREEFQE
ncbi:MAG: HD domain-containing protein [Patescibacteria group bacterium]